MSIKVGESVWLKRINTIATVKQRLILVDQRMNGEDVIYGDTDVRSVKIRYKVSYPFLWWRRILWVDADDVMRIML